MASRVSSCKPELSRAYVQRAMLSQRAEVGLSLAGSRGWMSFPTGGLEPCGRAHRVCFQAPHLAETWSSKMLNNETNRPRTLARSNNRLQLRFKDSGGQGARTPLGNHPDQYGASRKIPLPTPWEGNPTTRDRYDPAFPAGSTAYWSAASRESCWIETILALYLYPSTLTFVLPVDQSPGVIYFI
ncbi:hypothetical protein ABW21_db0201096 [Orbilia brochopaga]|nr:hypothetical protein ABW21_db0201096 [Drechslerella brochopaga]